MEPAVTKGQKIGIKAVPKLRQKALKQKKNIYENNKTQPANTPSWADSDSSDSDSDEEDQSAGSHSEEGAAEIEGKKTSKNTKKAGRAQRLREKITRKITGKKYAIPLRL